MRTGYLGNTLLKPSDEAIEFSTDQVNEMIRCSTDVIYFIKNYVKIVNVDRGVMNFEMYPFQETMIRTFHENRFSICKLPRQQGKSTTVVAFLLHYLLFNENVSVAILANKASTSRELLSRMKFAYELLPKWMQHGVVEWNKGNIELDNGSKARAASTSGDSIRGFTFNCVTGDSILDVTIDGVQKYITMGELVSVLNNKEQSQIHRGDEMKFLDNKYKVWYDLIIDRARNRAEITEGEWHHIIPKSLGGSNELSNLVKLTYREHFVVHKLLTKITEGQVKHKMVFALFRMIHGRQPKVYATNLNSHKYQYLRSEFIEAARDSGTGRLHTEETKKRISDSKQGQLKGIPLSDSHRKSISDSLAGRTKSEEWVNKINRNPDKIAKTAEKHRGMTRSAASREKMRAAKVGYVPWTQGKKWCQNPVTGESKMIAGEIPDGWLPGKFSNAGTKGKKWAHNPESKERRFVDALPDGFVWGMGRWK